MFCQNKFLAHQINKSQFILKVSSEVLCCQNKFLRAWNKHITIYIERIKRLSPLFCKWVPHATNRNQDCLNILKGIKGSPSFVPWGLWLSRSFLYIKGNCSSRSCLFLKMFMLTEFQFINQYFISYFGDSIIIIVVPSSCKVNLLVRWSITLIYLNLIHYFIIS